VGEEDYGQRLVLGKSRKRSNAAMARTQEIEAGKKMDDGILHFDGVGFVTTHMAHRVRTGSEEFGQTSVDKEN